MRIIISIVLLCFFWGGVPVDAIEIAPGEPLALKQQIIGRPPIDTHDENGYWWYPKADLGVSLNQATSGLGRYFASVSRLILPGGDPGFDGRSVDGRMTLYVSGPEKAIKKISVRDIPFCMDPIRFSKGSWADAEPAMDVLAGLITGILVYDGAGKAHEIAVSVFRDILSKPQRDFMTKELLTTDGCVDLGCHFNQRIERELGLFSVMTVRCSRRSLDIDITPPRSKK